MLAHGAVDHRGGGGQVFGIARVRQEGGAAEGEVEGTAQRIRDGGQSGSRRGCGDAPAGHGEANGEGTIERRARHRGGGVWQLPGAREAEGWRAHRRRLGVGCARGNVRGRPRVRAVARRDHPVEVPGVRLVAGHARGAG